MRESGHIEVLVETDNNFTTEHNMKIISGNGNRALAKDIANHLGMELTDCEVTTFSDGEVFVEVKQNVRGQDVFIVQPTCVPANHNVMELLIMIDAVMRASARRVTAVVPYFGYARQDRKVGPRTPISAKLVANMMVRAGAQRAMTLDLHSTQIQGFFDIPVDNLMSGRVVEEDVQQNPLLRQDNIVVVSPDVGGVLRARNLAKRVNSPLAIVDKRRSEAGKSEVMNVIGDVAGKDCVLFDDIVDSGGTLCNAASALLTQGARRVLAYITHGVLSNHASQRIAESRLTELVVSNSIPLSKEAQQVDKIRNFSVTGLLADAISRTHREESVSSLFS